MSKLLFQPRCGDRSALVLSLVLLASCSVGTEPHKTEILWDTWGVPHIYAADEPSLFEAYGYAQAQSHANLILKLYGEARGRAAEYWGEAGLENDRYVRRMGIPVRAQTWYAAQDTAFRRALDAFAAGINRFADQRPAEIADSVKPVLPVSGVDVMAHAQRVVHFTFVHGNERAIAAFRRLPARPGSNMWAIGPSRSASGNAMLLANPHLAWSDLFLFYEAQLTGPGVDAYGATLVGFPVPVIAFNDFLGWSHTVNTFDGTDAFRLTKAGDGYEFDGERKAFDSVVELIQVKLGDGGSRTDSLVVRRSVHGPVVEDSGATAVAVRVAGLDRPGMLRQWWDMARARTLPEFEAVVKRLDIPMFNIMYADRAGHIYYLFGGNVAVRSRGDFGFWQRSVRGDTSGTLWREYLPYEKLPRLVDPTNGWLQNANDPPWSSTVPVALHPDSFPSYLSPLGMGFRAQRSAHMLVADSSVTFDELVEYKHSTRMELADRLLDDLVRLGRGGSQAARRGAEVLAKWDRQANADSRGAVLFQAWVEDWASTAEIDPFRRSWRLDQPLATPAGIADPRAAVRALESAVSRVEQRFGSLDVPWGEVNRIRYNGIDLPGNGAPGDPLGVFRVAYYMPDQDGKSAITAGDTYYAAIEFSNPVRAKVLLAYGNATQPGSKHRGDQLELFSRRAMRDVWRTRAEVEANLASRIELK